MAAATGPPRLTVLSGGLGGARLALAVTEAGRARGTTFVTNVADDWIVGRLPVCPDTDSVLYALSGRFDEERGWGVCGDVFTGARGDEPSWFGIGALDRATHEHRHALMANGASLAAATAALARAAGVDANVVPVTCDRVRTNLLSAGAWLEFQEWMVRDRGPTVEAIRWDGLDAALPSPGVIEALSESEVVVIAASSPMASLAPILGVAGVRSALRQRRGPTLALSSVVLGRAPCTDRDRHRASARRQLLEAAGIADTPSAIAVWLAPLVSHFALDACDAEFADAVAATGAIPLLAPVIGIDSDERRSLVALFESLRGCPRSSHPTTVTVS
jgi:LPPG:FO 2-phospho-L-lactate transferase